MVHIRTFIVLNLLVILLSNVSTTVQAELKKPSKSQSQKAMANQSEEKFEGKIAVSYKYLLSLPEDYDRQEKWPLLS